MEITALRVNEMAIAFEIAVRRESYYGFFHIAYLQGGHEYRQKFCTGSLELMDAFICQRSLDGRLNHWLSRLVRRLRVD